MTFVFTPQALHIAAFAREGKRHASVERLSRFPRLTAEMSDQNDDRQVHFWAEGCFKPNTPGAKEPWITLSASTTLQLTCQRCLDPVAVPVAFEREFRFVANEALAAVEDEESEEDVLVISTSFDLMELIEDEFLMAMPTAPMHAQCPKRVKLQVADAAFVDARTPSPNAFSVLNALKGPKP